MDTSWREMVRALEASGMTLVDIGAEIGLSVAGVSDIKHGRTEAPTGWRAVKLFQLHARECLPPPANDDTYTPDTDPTAAAPAAGEG